MAPGPFKIILTALEQGTPDTLGNPAADRVRAELARLFNLDDAMASSIVSAIPIIVLDGLDARTAGVVRERLQVLVRAGCRITTTDEPSDTIPRINWPELPAIAQVAPESAAQPASRAGVRSGELCCPSCGTALQLVPAGSPGRRASSSDEAPRLPPRDVRDETRASSRLSAAALPASPPPPAAGPAPETPARSTPPPAASPAPAAARQRSLEDSGEDDWMAPPVQRVVPPSAEAPAREPAAHEEPGPRSGSARFDHAALLAYRRAEAELPLESSPPPPPPSPAPLSGEDEQLQVTFSDSGDLLEGSDEDLVSADRDPFRELDPEPVRFGGRGDPFADDPSEERDPFRELSPRGDDEEEFVATGSLHDSGSDILDVDPPHRRSGSDARKSAFEDDLGLLDDDPRPAPTRGRSFDELELLEDSADVPPARTAEPARGRAPMRDPLDLLAESDELPAPRGRGAARGGDGEPQLEEVMRLFGPEDEEPLDDMAGLEPAPLDLSPRPSGSGKATGSRAAARANGRAPAGDPFDDASDILEPLNPAEAMEIIKSQKGRQASSRSGSGGPFESLDVDELDLFGASREAPPPSRAGKPHKKTRGVPFSASDEDLALFDEGRASGSGGGRRAEPAGGDPFARARKAMAEEARYSRSGERDGAGGNGGARSTGRRRAEPTRGGGRGAPEPARGRGSSERASPGRSSGKARSAGPPPAGDGEHGLVLSRINDPEKKDKAAQLIAEIKGCSLDDAQRLTDRTIIPVLKGVSKEVAEFHLDKFKRFKIAGRVTTRQRS